MFMNSWFKQRCVEQLIPHEQMCWKWPYFHWNSTQNDVMPCHSNFLWFSIEILSNYKRFGNHFDFICNFNCLYIKNHWFECAIPRKTFKWATDQETLILRIKWMERHKQCKYIQNKHYYTSNTNRVGVFQCLSHTMRDIQDINCDF